MSDLDEVLQSFLDLENVIEDLTGQHTKITQDHEILTKRYTTTIESKKGAEEEVKKYQKLVDKYQFMLTDFNRIKDDNSTLKEHLATAKSEKLNLEQEIVVNNENFAARTAELEAKQVGELEKVRQEANTYAQSEIEIYKNKLGDLRDELEEAKSLLNDRTRQHEMEVARMKMDHETAVHKIQQRHLAAANTSTGSMSARNDIYRKKLQVKADLIFGQNLRLKVKQSSCL